MSEPADDPWQPVDGSSAIEATLYDAGSQVLKVRLRGGAVVEHAGVPSSVVQALRDSPSSGSFWHKQVRDRYRSPE